MGAGYSGAFVCYDEDPKKVAFATFNQTRMTSQPNAEPPKFPRMLPLVTFKEGGSMLAFKEGGRRIHTVLTERGLDGKPDRILWDAIFDKKFSIVDMAPGTWDFTWLLPVPGSKVGSFSLIQSCWKLVVQVRLLEWSRFVHIRSSFSQFPSCQ